MALKSSCFGCYQGWNLLDVHTIWIIFQSDLVSQIQFSHRLGMLEAEADRCPPALGKNNAGVMTEVSIPEKGSFQCMKLPAGHWTTISIGPCCCMRASTESFGQVASSARQRKGLPDWLISSQIFYNLSMQSKPRFGNMFFLIVWSDVIQWGKCWRAARSSCYWVAGGGKGSLPSLHWPLCLLGGKRVI